MKRLAVLLAILAPSAAVADLRCSLETEVFLHIEDGGDKIEIRRDGPGGVLTIGEEDGAIIVEGKRCERRGDTRFTCPDGAEVAILGDRIRMFSPHFGGVGGDAGLALFSGQCNSVDQNRE